MPTNVAPPTRTPPRFGLFSVAEVRDPNGHELRGVSWQPDACENPSLWSTPCSDNPPAPEAEKCLDCQPMSDADGYPLNVYGTFACPLIGYGVSEAQRRARANLLTGEQNAVEYAFMSGESMPLGGGLAAGATLAGTAVCGPELLELLYAITDVEFAGEPVFHMPRPAAVWLADNGLLRQVGDQLQTELGTPVAAGTGYTRANTAPDGETTPAGGWWVYATGPVLAYRGDVMDLPDPGHQGINTTTNDYLAIAERTWVIGTECLNVAALFTPGCP